MGGGSIHFHCLHVSLSEQHTGSNSAPPDETHLEAGAPAAMELHTPILVSRSVCSPPAAHRSHLEGLGAVLWWRSDGDPWAARCLQVSVSRIH